MKYNLPNRKSIRLKGYDYSQAGLYFVTICTQNRKYLFGNIKNQQMILNDAGQMVKKWYYELENKFNDIKCREMVIMPNHFHCIIENIGITVGADLRVCPNTTDNEIISNNETISGNVTNSDNETNSGNVTNSGNETNSDNENIKGEHIGSPLRAVVQWFKTMTTNEYIRGVKNKKWQRFDKKLWQRNYWEHIIRNENENYRIAKYIVDNPLKWNDDKLNNGDGNILMESSANYGNEIWMI